MRLFVILLSLTVLTACSSSQTEETTANNLDSLNLSQYSINEQPAKTIIDFLKWYKEYEDESGCLVLNACNDVYDSTKYYAVNFEETEKYLNKLKQSGFISENYITTWREYFKKCDEDFKSNPQNDGPPDGFDYDFVMNSQDYDQELKTLDDASVSEMTGTDSNKTIKLRFATGTTLTYTLSLISGKWYIDKIK